MTTRATIKQADIERAIRACIEAGLVVAEIVIEADCARVKFGVAESRDTPEGPKPKQWPKA